MISRERKVNAKSVSESLWNLKVCYLTLDTYNFVKQIQKEKIFEKRKGKLCLCIANAAAAINAGEQKMEQGSAAADRSFVGRFFFPPWISSLELKLVVVVARRAAGHHRCTLPSFLCWSREPPGRARTHAHTHRPEKRKEIEIGRQGSCQLAVWASERIMKLFSHFWQRLWSYFHQPPHLRRLLDLRRPDIPVRLPGHPV